MDIKQQVLEVAAKSHCVKRKVGAIITSANGIVLAEGFNHRPTRFNKEDCFCEDNKGNTLPDVIHAEVNAINNLKDKHHIAPLTMYVSHQPCKACQAALFSANIHNIEIVEEFMKFDTDKLRYDLIPPSALKGLAEVLTYGAKKYKPNNWKNVKEADRYIAAAFRHFEAYRSGKKVDKESGLHHLKHLMTNVAFLLELDSDDFWPNLNSPD